jgi:glycosyltransferase involved in cell wall biosynthesis
MSPEYEKVSRNIAEPDPDYVQVVKGEFERVQLKPLHLSALPLPPRTSPIVVCVVKNEGERLADLLRHYRTAGIRRFCFIDNGSTDGSLEFLTAQPDVDLLERRGHFEWKLKQGWICRAIYGYGLDRWFMHIDADEHIVYEGMAHRSFGDLAAEMEARGLWRVRGFLLDMYPEGPLLKSNYTAGGRLMDSYAFYDRAGYVENRFKELMSVKGGPRKRVFSEVDPTFNPEMSKYPLFRLRPGEYTANPHHIWPYRDNFTSERYMAILHYMFLPSLAKKIRTALIEKNYWADSMEYRCYHEILLKKPDLALYGEISGRYDSPEVLVQEGLIASVGWTRPISLTDAMLTAARVRRAAVQGSVGFAPAQPDAAPAAAKSSQVPSSP